MNKTNGQGPITRQTAFVLYNHRATPPCDEQVPERLCEKLYVPSLHCAVAPAGGLGAEYGLHTVFPAVLTDVPFGQLGIGAGGWVVIVGGGRLAK